MVAVNQQALAQAMMQPAPQQQVTQVDPLQISQAQGGGAPMPAVGGDTFKTLLDAAMKKSPAAESTNAVAPDSVLNVNPNYSVNSFLGKAPVANPYAVPFNLGGVPQ